MNLHTAAVNAVKKALTEAPVLHYYDVITIQCDASDTGLGADLLQKRMANEHRISANSDMWS